jgi:hypothetical protein
MAWIESHQQLVHHPKLLKLSNLTGWTLNETIGVLHRLWWWTLAYAEDGDLSKYEPTEICLALDLSQTKDRLNSESVFNLFIECNFIDSDLKIHDWLDYAGKYLTAKYRTSNPKKLIEIQKKYKGRTSRTKVSKKSVVSQTPLPTNQPLPTNLKESMDFPSYFESFWKQYPNKDGKIAALKHFTASIKGEKDLQDIQTALDNYKLHIKSAGIKPQYIKNGSTWFYNWRDWVDYKPPVDLDKEKDNAIKIKELEDSIAHQRGMLKQYKSAGANGEVDETEKLIDSLNEELSILSGHGVGI